MGEKKVAQARVHSLDGVIDHLYRVTNWSPTVFLRMLLHMRQRVVLAMLRYKGSVKLGILVFQLWQGLGTGMRAHANHTAQQYLLPIVLVCSFCIALGGGQGIRTIRVAFLLTKVRLNKHHNKIIK